MRSRSAPRSVLIRKLPVGSRKTSCGCGASCCATAPLWSSLKWKVCSALAEDCRGSLKVERAEPPLVVVSTMFYNHQKEKKKG